MSLTSRVYLCHLLAQVMIAMLGMLLLICQCGEGRVAKHMQRKIPMQARAVSLALMMSLLHPQLLDPR